MSIKEYIIAAQKLLIDTDIPVFPVFTGKNEQEMLNFLAENGGERNRAVCLVPESATLRTSNTAAVFDKFELACYYATLYSNANLDAAKCYLDDLEKIIRTLHCSRIKNTHTLRCGTPAFSLVRNSAGLLIFRIPFVL